MHRAPTCNFYCPVSASMYLACLHHWSSGFRGFGNISGFCRLSVNAGRIAVQFPAGQQSHMDCPPIGLALPAIQPFRLITKPKGEDFPVKYLPSQGADRRIFALNKTVVCDPRSHNRIPVPGKTLFHIYRSKKAQNGPACCGTTYSDPAPVPAPEWYGAATCLPGSTG